MFSHKWYSCMGSKISNIFLVPLSSLCWYVVYVTALGVSSLGWSRDSPAQARNLTPDTASYGVCRIHRQQTHPCAFRSIIAPSPHNQDYSPIISDHKNMFTTSDTGAETLTTCNVTIYRSQRPTHSWPLSHTTPHCVGGESSTILFEQLRDKKA